MSVAGKLLAIVLFVALAPLAVFSVTALRVHEQALDADVVELHRQTADYGMRATSAFLAAARRTTSGLVRTIPWADLSADERRGALTLVYQQLEDVSAVLLLDTDGEHVLDNIAGDPTRHHPELAPAAASAFAHAIPVAEAREHGSATGRVVMVAGDAPIVAIAFTIARPSGPPWTLAVALSLRGACSELALASPPGIAVRLEDSDGRLLCGAPRPEGELVSASAQGAHDWRVVAEQPTARAMASLHRIRAQSVFWIFLGALGAVSGGLVLAQAIRRPLRRLSDGAAAIARGNYEHRVGASGHDEFGRLAASFDRMSGEIERKNTELRAWNEDLQQRVDARTAELQDAQDQLLQSRKLGAMAALTAGVAHELNNPLAGVLGLAQILRARADVDERTQRSAASIEREALRMRDVIEKMASLVQDSTRDGAAVAVVTAVAAAAAQHVARLAAGRIVLERAFAPDVPMVRGNAMQLEQAVSQLVENSINAMPDGGTLRITVRVIERELVAIDVEDTGRGIAPEVLDKIFEPFFTTKDNWHGVGLGLAVVQRIVEAHHGRIRAVSRLGAGTTMTITLPAGRRGSNLE